MKPAADSTHPAAPSLEPFLLGTALSAFSSLAYSCANVCLRHAATSDPLLVSCIKAVPTLLVAVVIISAGAFTGRLRWPSRSAFLLLIVTGVVSQLGGNGLFQWSLGQVGLALTVPLCSGTMIIGAVFLARFWLGEGVTTRSAVALAVLIIAIFVLSYGAERAPQKAEIATATAPITLALAATCFSGIVYGGLNVVIRRLVTGSTQMPVVLAVISSAGVISLGAGSYYRLGIEGIEQTPLKELGVMFVAGVFNAIGFFSLTKALQLVSIVQVNAVSASQSAFAALAGVAVFGESITISLVVGVLLTIIGLGLVDRGRKVHFKPPAEELDPTSTGAIEDAEDSAEADQLDTAGVLRREPTIK